MQFLYENEAMTTDTDEALLTALRKAFGTYEIEPKYITNGAGETAVATMTHFVFIHDKNQWDVPVRFFRSEEARALLRLYSVLRHADTSEWEVASKQKIVSSRQEGVTVFGMSDVLIDMAKSLMTVQRYKGLGEMNPEQLWETTMNPENRRLFQVTVEDALRADQWFSSLMGESVDDRREYIQKHAHFVRNLDI